MRALVWALAVFAALAVAAWFVPLQDEGPIQDRFRYERITDNLLDHGVYSSCPVPPYKPEFERMPGFPVFWAGVKWLSGGRESGLIMAQAALHVLSALALFMLTMTLVSDPRLALITEIAWLLSPMQLAYVFIAGSEMIATATSAVGLAALAAYLAHGGRRKFVLAFIALLASAFVRPNFFLLPPFLLIVAFITRRKNALRPLLLLTFGFVVAFAPWTIRNYVAFGKLTPASHNFIWWNWCQTAHQYVSDEALDTVCLHGYPSDSSYPSDPLNECDYEKNLTFDALMRERAIAAFEEHPALNVLAFAVKPAREWQVMSVGFPTYTLLRRVLSAILLIPFVVGCVLLWRRRDQGWIVGAVCFYASMTALPAPSAARYVMPAAFLYFLAVLYAIVALVRRRRP